MHEDLVITLREALKNVKELSSQGSGNQYIIEQTINAALKKTRTEEDQKLALDEIAKILQQMNSLMLKAIQIADINDVKINWYPSFYEGVFDRNYWQQSGQAC